MRILKVFLIIISLAIMAGCAGSLKNQQYSDQQLKDPFKSLNHSFYELNDTLDKTILRPAAIVYTQRRPSILKKGVTNFFNNLAEPNNFINSFLQLKPKKGLTALSRFVVNSTVGLGGFVDFMTKIGEPQQPEDFGQTLAYWGVKPGPYLMLPILGPSNARDGFGYIVDTLMFNPPVDLLRITPLSYNFIKAVDTRANLLPADAILEKQFDKYTFLRGAYEQVRINEVFDGSPPQEEEDF